METMSQTFTVDGIEPEPVGTSNSPNNTHIQTNHMLSRLKWALAGVTAVSTASITTLIIGNVIFANDIPNRTQDTTDTYIRVTTMILGLCALAGFLNVLVGHLRRVNKAASHLGQILQRLRNRRVLLVLCGRRTAYHRFRRSYICKHITWGRQWQSGRGSHKFGWEWRCAVLALFCVLQVSVVNFFILMM